VINAAAQSDQFIFDQLTSENGLSDNSVLDIVQDENGFVWIATLNGLNRFDGVQFEKIFRGDKPNQLPGNEVTKLAKMRGNYMAVGTDLGAAIFNTRTEEFKRLTIPSAEGMEWFANNIQSVSGDRKNELIITSRTGVFVFNQKCELIAKLEAGFTAKDLKTKGIGFAGATLKLNDDTVLVNTSNGIAYYDVKRKGIGYLKNSKIDFHRYAANFLDSTDSYAMSTGAKNILIVVPTNGKSNSAFIIDFEKQKIIASAIPGNFAHESGWPSNVCTINDSTFLFASAYNGYFVLHYNKKDGKIFVEDKKFFPQYLFRSFYAGRDKRIWCATGNYGVLKQSFSKELFNNISLGSYPEFKTGAYEVRAFYTDDSFLYVGVDASKIGLLIFNKQKKLVRKINLNDYTSGGNDIWGITPWYNDTIAIATQTGLLFYTVRDNKISKPAKNFPALINTMPVTNVHRDKNNNTWIGLGFGNGVLLYNRATGHIQQFTATTGDSSFRLRYPNIITEDTKKGIWFFHSSQGLVRWSYDTQRFDTLITSFKGENINYYDFAWVDADKEGNLWMGFGNYGLMKWNLYTGERKIYTVKSGLADNSVVNVFTAVPGQVWMYYRHGLGVMDLKTGATTNFNKGNGLPDFTASSLNFYYDSSQKKMFIGFPDAFTIFDPYLVATEKTKPKVYVTSIKVPGDSITLNPDENLSLKYFQNNLAINFSSVDFDNGPDNNYEYRLYKNENSTWINILHQQTVNLINLSPGNYTFQVRVVSDDSSIATERIKIAYPFYQTWWFYLLLAIVVATVLYGLYRYRINSLVQLQNVRNRISADLHDDIGARLTNINLLSALSEQKLGEPGQASEYLKRISGEVQNSGEALDDIVWSINTRNDSMDEITARMRRHAADVFDGTIIHYSIDADENVSSVKLPMAKRRDLFLVYKEVINNIHKHAAATKVEITIASRSGNLLMRIEDNGKGFDTEKPTHRNGLKNIQYRIEKNKGDVTIDSIPGKGTTVVIWLPVRGHSPKRGIINWFLKE
jgi:signal transduction histidine kinase/ligand-binding sensor domain-containing protein